ncbi:M20/M25/M40 family metallo-hydrolase [Campylobacter peloridis]|uniref:M20/M25/M40 family metallo-hydrolase n=1 Tax=Campylobacter peloridis TaxID=488546 RepID=A0ABX6TR99_9BACT|nr:M20/M25/M40 family metallo-hydrolase [Campylobacter peloridis]AJC84371.1 aminoacyl-histidine dipeptidase [Campylobacter peloridis LMG 23910]QOQ88467.1 M20/M25/M40 family metallo-hydrolase [Campylobacter peloridis]
MQEIIQNFKQITQIPHCSFQTEQLQKFLIDFAKEQNCEVKIDKAGNIHAYKGKPKICLQSHYDMVCMGEAPNIQMYEENGYLKAKNSSLGADNGIGVSLMMQALKEFENIECLFTNNEEVGLCGANDLQHSLIANKLLNLDHESDDEVVIGCAGGVDIFANLALELDEKEEECYELQAVGFKGGHSGIDIIKNIKNSIKEAALFISQNHGEICEFNGGERINSIPKHAKIIAFFKNPPKENDNFKIKSLGKIKRSYYKNSNIILNLINAFAQGVRTFNHHLNLVQTSINLSLAYEKDGKFYFELFARSNDLKELQNIEFETLTYFKMQNCQTSSANFYPPWANKDTKFGEEILNYFKKEDEKAKLYTIHAGLECGIISEKQPLECCSIGPNIYSPHSTDEKCEIASIEKISKILFNILKDYQ